MGGGRRAGYAAVLTAMLLISTNGIVSTLLFNQGALEPRELAAVRVYGSAIGLAPIAFRTLPRLSRREWLLIVAFGIFGVSLPQWSYYESISRIPVTISLIIIYMAPILVNGYERIVHRRRLPPAAYAAIAFAVGGVALTLLAKNSSTGRLDRLGVFFALLCLVLYAIQIVVWSKQPTHMSPLVNCGLGMVAGSLIWLVVVPVWTLPFGRLGQAVDLGPRLAGSLPLWLLALYSIVIGTLIPYVLLTAGTPTIGPGAGSVTSMVEPAATAVWAWIVLMQTLTTTQSLGVVVSLFAVTATELLRSRHVPNNIADTP